jgi:protein-tyrosine phosphatase
MITVMTVCTGNICRSAMAEMVLRHRLAEAGLGDDVRVLSRGISDEERGNPIDRRARRTLVAHGYPGGDDHVAAQVRRDELAGTDLVLAMTAHHARHLRRMVADDLPVVMYRSFDPAAPDAARGESRLDIADPWWGDQDDFEICLTQVEAAADGIVDEARRLLGR